MKIYFYGDSCLRRAQVDRLYRKINLNQFLVMALCGTMCKFHNKPYLLPAGRGETIQYLSFFDKLSLCIIDELKSA